MESGYAAAKTIEEADRNSTPDSISVCAAYEQNTSALRAYMLRQWNFVASMASTFGYMRL
jgi:hypothetical protein